MINKFRGKYDFLSNFYSLQKYVCLTGDKRWYPTTEHAFQAAKSNDEAYRDLILTVSAGESKRLGKLCKLREDWEEVKYSIMHRLVFLKFLFNKKLREQLLATGDEELVEGNTWCDIWWGKCNCKKHNGIGENKLGEILMKVREQLRNHNEG